MQIKIYGSNETLNSNANSENTIASIAALTDISSKTIDCRFVRFYKAQEGTEFEAPGGVLSKKSKQRRSFAVELNELNFNESSDRTIYDDVMSILNKNNHWISNVDYPYDFVSDSSINALKVVTDYETVDEPPYYQITLEMKSERPIA